MTNQNFHWAGNLKLLRNRKKMSQEELAEKLGISRSKLAAHESGKTVNPPVEDLCRFSDFYKVSIDTLLKVDLFRLGELKLRELEAGNDVYIKGGNLRVLAITVDRNNRENVEYVPIKAKAGYSAGHNDPEYIASLPKLSLPKLPANGTFRVFPIIGNSMLPIPDGSDITAQFVEDWSTLRADTACIVILKDQDFVFKLATVQGDGSLLLKSLNSEYRPYTVPLSDVLEIWKYHSFTAYDMPEATDLGAISRSLMEIRQQLQMK